jgi:small-conductance mechanosensitive channel
MFTIDVNTTTITLQISGIISFIIIFVGLLRAECGWKNGIFLFFLMLLFLMLVSYHIIANLVKLNDQTTNYVYFGSSIALPFFISILYFANKGGTAAYEAAASAFSNFRR